MMAGKVTITAEPTPESGTTFLINGRPIFEEIWRTHISHPAEEGPTTIFVSGRLADGVELRKGEPLTVELKSRDTGVIMTAVITDNSDVIPGDARYCRLWCVHQPGKGAL